MNMHNPDDLPNLNAADMDPNLGGDAEFSRALAEIAAAITVHSPLRTLAKTYAPLPHGPWFDKSEGKWKKSTLVDPATGREPAITKRKLGHAVVTRLRAGQPLTLDESNRLADLLEGLLDPYGDHYDLEAVKRILRSRYRELRAAEKGKKPKQSKDETVISLVDRWNLGPRPTDADYRLVRKDEQGKEEADYETLHMWLKEKN